MNWLRHAVVCRLIGYGVEHVTTVHAVGVPTVEYGTSKTYCLGCGKRL